MPHPNVPGRTPLSDDLLWGVDGPDGIAKFLGIPARKAYDLIARKKLPVRKLGPRTITASRHELRRVFTDNRESDTE
jgi:hypothetical protein